MNPKDQAKELIDKYYFALVHESYDKNWHTKCKQFALICVEEIIDIASVGYDDDHLNWWQKVKQELEKL